MIVLPELSTIFEVPTIEEPSIATLPPEGVKLLNHGAAVVSINDPSMAPYTL